MSKKHRRASGANPSLTTTASVTLQTDFRVSNPNSFNPDYSFIIKDLKTIGILAATFITILIVLSFILK